MSAYIFQIQSSLIILLIFYGIYHRKNRFKHVKTMKLCIAWDLLLVAQIELTRGAIIKASQALTNTAILNIHVSLAVSTVLLYFVMLYTGTRLKNNDESIRKLHRFLGLTTLTLRLSTFITSFLVL